MADGLVQTFFFRAVNDMEKNQVKQEERLRKKGGGDWFDIGEFSTLLCELDAVATQVGKLLWVVNKDKVQVQPINSMKFAWY